MSYPPGNWPLWQQPSPQHSPVEIEHRLTTLESITEQHGGLHEGHSTTQQALEKRIRLHEKAILGILGALNVLAQDKYPAMAKAIRGLLP